MNMLAQSRGKMEVHSQRSESLFCVLEAFALLFPSDCFAVRDFSVHYSYTRGLEQRKLKII